MPNETLFVVMGAGASYAASSGYDSGVFADRRPPLVKELFEPRFADILNRYPMAKNAAPDIKDAMEERPGAPAVSLEDHIRTRYRDSDDEFDQRRFLSLPLYLQELLWWVSEPDELDPDNLNRLINRLLDAYTHVCFITLNYDVLLDRCLAALNPLASLRHFISYERWSLIKLHGSITWGYELHDVGGLDLVNPPAQFATKIDRSEIFHDWNLNKDALRIKSTTGKTFNSYPALSVPLGPDDEIVCPEEHQEFVRERLTEVGAVDLLVVGYSAFDQTMLDLIKESSESIRSLYVVNAGLKPAREVAVRMARHFGINVNSNGVDIAKDPFDSWVRGGIDPYLEWLPKLS
jgi:hypothetical protein